MAEQDDSYVVEGDWPITQKFREKYTRRFNFLDTERQRYLVGYQIYHSFKIWNLTNEAMAKVWELADVDENDQLVCEEFILAMHLCSLAQKSEIPDVLPEYLCPPLF